VRLHVLQQGHSFLLQAGFGYDVFRVFRHFQHHHGSQFYFFDSVFVFVVLVKQLFTFHLCQLFGCHSQYLPGCAFIFFPVRLADAFPAEQQVRDGGEDFLNHAYDIILSNHGF